MSDEDELDLDAMEARCNAATPGPWWVEPRVYDKDGRILHDAFIAHGVHGLSSETYDLMDSYNFETDYVFIAHARADVPVLVARVRELEAAMITNTGPWLRRLAVLEQQNEDLQREIDDLNQRCLRLRLKMA